MTCFAGKNGNTRTSTEYRGQWNAQRHMIHVCCAASSALTAVNLVAEHITWKFKSLHASS